MPGKPFLFFPALVLACALTLSACGDDEVEEVGEVGEIGEVGDVGAVPAAPVVAPGATTFDPALDMNQDGILGADEGMGDADGDGILDRDEVYPATP